ncbi:hypothetical protein T439DRAFT_304797 [Meredithblackwellia eburnea MCA 4105]
MPPSYPPDHQHSKESTPALEAGKRSSSPFDHNSSDSDDENDYDRQMSLANTALNSGRRNRDAPSPLRSLTPKRIAVIAVGLLFLIFWFGKGTGSRTIIEEDEDLFSDNVNKQPAGEVAPDRVDVPVANLPPQSPQKGKAKPGSSKCTPPPGKKAKSYALMIDAGSTGSRLHLYTFSHCDPEPNALPKLEDEGFFTTKPGLSSYAGKPREAAESLRVLLDHAIAGVPADERKCTPIAVKATAGLRLLGVKESNAILEEVERWLQQEWPFSLVEDGVMVMDGKDEGVYAWITINFLLGMIGPSNDDPSATAAVMDLGGASTQIVFEPTFQTNSKLAPGDHVYDLDFAGKAHVLYQHSHLGYGLMQARRAVHNLVAFSYVWSSAPKGKTIEWDDLTKSDKIHNPCMFKGETKVVDLDPPGRKPVTVTMVGTGAGFEACRRVVDVMIAKDAMCETPPCAFAGVYQPALGEVFSAGKVWALSYFYDRIAPLGLTSPFRISELRQLTSDVCAGRNSPKWSRFKGNAEALAELDDRPEYCLDLTFQYSLLALGYELDEERQIWMGKKVAGVELGWALGAAIAMIDGKLSCRAD